jgi:DNA anti-recombination protein RmuC
VDEASVITASLMLMAIDRKMAAKRKRPAEKAPEKTDQTGREEKACSTIKSIRNHMKKVKQVRNQYVLAAKATSTRRL